MSVTQYTYWRWQLLGLILPHPLEWYSRRKKPRLSANSHWWLCVRRNSDGRRRAHPMLNRRSIRMKTTRVCVSIEQYSKSTKHGHTHSYDCNLTKNTSHWNTIPWFTVSSDKEKTCCPPAFQVALSSFYTPPYSTPCSSPRRLLSVSWTLSHPHGSHR